MAEEDPELAAGKVVAIQPTELESWRDNMQKLPKQVYAYTDEWKELSKFIDKFVEMSH